MAEEARFGVILVVLQLRLYLWTMERIITKCHNCSKQFLIKKTSYIYLLKKNSNQRFFCGKSCSAKCKNRDHPLVVTSEGRARAAISYKARCAKRPQLAYLRLLVTLARKRATRFNREFSITFEDVLDLFKRQHGKCAYTSFSLDVSKYKTGHPRTREERMYRASLDRIDNDKGYTVDNIQLVCAPVNNMKNTLSHADFVNLCRLIADRPLVSEDHKSMSNLQLQLL